MTKKLFLQFEYGYQNNAEFYADFGTVEKNVKKLLTKKVIDKIFLQSCSLFSSILLTCKSFWQITFSLSTFFQYFHGF
jgi:hypothetical protein